MKKIIAISVSVLAPVIAFAQTAPITDVNSLSKKVLDIFNLASYMLIAFAFVWIVYNVIRFIMSDGDKRTEFRSSFLWGIVGLAAIFAIWGLVNIVSGTFRTQNQNQNQLPPIQNQINNSNLPPVVN